MKEKECKWVEYEGEMFCGCDKHLPTPKTTLEKRVEEINMKKMKEPKYCDSCGEKLKKIASWPQYDQYTGEKVLEKRFDELEFLKAETKEVGVWTFSIDIEVAMSFLTQELTRMAEACKVEERIMSKPLPDSDLLMGFNIATKEHNQRLANYIENL